MSQHSDLIHMLSGVISRIKIGILWDFDGVLARSDLVKWHIAWEVVFADEPILCSFARSYMETPEGRHASRFKTIDKVLADAQEKGIVPLRTAKEYADAYGMAVRAEVPKAGLYPGALEALSVLMRVGVSQHLISGTQQGDLDEVTAVLGIRRFFRSIRGGTGEDKITHAREIIATEPEVDIWWGVGDQQADFELAKAVGASFIGIRSFYNGWTEHEQFPTLATAADVPHFLVGVTIQSAPDRKSKKSEKRGPGSNARS